MEFLNVSIDDERFIRLEDDTKIARYMGEEKFTKNLTKRGIWFTNTKQFDDNHERTLAPYILEGKINPIVGKIAERTASKCNAYVSCWTNFKKGENAALWKIFDTKSDGVCIISTVGQLKEQLEKEFHLKNVVGAVDYDEKNAPMLNIEKVASNYLSLEFLKIRPYFFEEEIRAVIYSKEYKKGYNVGVDWKKIVNKVIISPFTTDEQARKLEEMINKYFGADVLLKSKLNENKKD